MGKLDSPSTTETQPLPSSTLEGAELKSRRILNQQPMNWGVCVIFYSGHNRAPLKNDWVTWRPAFGHRGRK